PLPPLVADEPQLQRVVANLLGNAIKYTETGGRITVSTARENGLVAVAFRDTGRGIPAEEIPRLFEKYRRVREVKRTEGTGLGLFIAKTIVEAHGETSGSLARPASARRSRCCCREPPSVRGRHDGRSGRRRPGRRWRRQRHVLRRAPGMRDGFDHTRRVHGLGQARRLDEVEHGRQLALLGAEHVTMHLEPDPAARIARELDRLVDDVDRRAVARLAVEELDVLGKQTHAAVARVLADAGGGVRPVEAV